MWKFLQFFQFPPHFHHKVIEFGLEIVFNAVTKQRWKSTEHGDCVSVIESDFFKVIDSGYEFLFDGGGEEGGVFVDFGYADALEEVEGGAEAGLDGAEEETGAAVDDAAEVGALDAGFAEEEGEDGDEGGDFGGEDFGAHGGDAAEVGGGEAGGGAEEVDDGFDVGGGGGDDGRVGGEEGEEVDPD